MSMWTVCIFALFVSVQTRASWFQPTIFSDSLRMKRIGKLVATGLGGLLALEGYYGFVCQNCINMQI